MNNNFDTKVLYGNNLICFDIRNRYTFKISDFESVVKNFVVYKNRWFFAWISRWLGKLGLTNLYPLLAKLDTFEEMYYIHLYDSNHTYMGAFKFSILLYDKENEISYEFLSEMLSDILDYCREWNDKHNVLDSKFYLTIDNKEKIIENNSIS